MPNKKGADGLYRAFYSMHSRCLNPLVPNYPNYGGRGITISDEWLWNFKAFKRDMQPRPDGSSLDRIDSNKGYSKDNCRWASVKVQRRNRRDVILDKFKANQIRLLRSMNYQAKVLSGWFGVSVQTICDINKGRIWAD